MPGWQLKDGFNKPGFDDYFLLEPVPGQTPAADETDYAGNLKDLMDWLALLPASGGGAAAAKRQARTSVVKRLRDDAQAFCAGQKAARDAARQVLIQRGRYEAERDRIDQPGFTVEEVFDPATNRAVDVKINVGGEEAVPADKQTLFNDLDSAITIVKGVCERLKPDDPMRASVLCDEFMRRFAGCGRVGLQDDHPILAKAALKTLKADFYDRVAGSMKRTASAALGWRAFGTAAALMAVYFLLRWCDFHIAGNDLPHYFFHERKAFFALAAGAAVGTWLSFLIRSLDLSFDDLATISDDLLGPEIRVAFVIVLTLTLGLVVWTDAFSLSIGNMKVLPHMDGGVALLFGVFCGLSERALASAVSGRAGAFIKGVGG